MTAPTWIVVLGPIAAAIITATVTITLERYARNRQGRLDGVRTELDVSDALGDEDADLKAWLRDYARVRIVAIGLDETRTRRHPLEWLWSGAAAVSTLYFGAVVASYATKATADWSGLNVADIAFGFVVFPLAALLSALSVYVALIPSRYRMPGVSPYAQRAVRDDLLRLHGRMREAATRETATAAAQPLDIEGPESGA